MQDDLPIKVSSKGLFEQDDKSSSFLIHKLEAWLNFQALLANWYQDESQITHFSFQVLPESQFYQHQLDQELIWKSFELPGVTGVYHHDEEQSSFESYLMLSNSELDDMMKHPANVEARLKQKLRATINVQAVIYQLQPI